MQVGRAHQGKNSHKGALTGDMCSALVSLNQLNSIPPFVKQYIMFDKWGHFTIQKHSPQSALLAAL